MTMRAASPILHFILWGISCMGLASPVLGQTEAVLHSFGSGTDGKGPTGTLVQGTDGNFYGMTVTGGTFNEGTAFRMTPQGVVTILHNFGSTVTHDGTFPHGSLVLGADGNFYGTAALGGTANLGTVFMMTSQGAVTILHNFGGTANNDGSDPQGGMVLGGDGNFYGTTLTGGAGFSGTVFMMTPQGAVTILHSFQDGTVTNDGLSPQLPVVQGADGNFYGTTPQGGPAGRGTAFRITPQGTLTILHSFGDGSVTNDGQMPMSALIQLPDGNFYGTTSNGSVTSPNGVVYKMTSAGAITILHTFQDESVLNDGSQPNGALVLGSDGNLYGTAQLGGGVSNEGCVYELSSTGKFLILHGFQDGSVANDGSTPLTALVQGSDGNLYGMTQAGGANSSNGTAYVIAPTQMLVTSPTTASASVTLPFSYQVVATHAPTGFSATNLPDGLSIDPLTGLITGTPTTVQTKVAVITLTNAAGSENFSLTITVGSLPAPVVTSVLTAYGSVGAAFTYTTTATNAPTGYAATGLTGTGLSIDPATGIISGTPTSAGTLSVSLTASNATGPGAAASLSINILAAPPTLSQEYGVPHRFGDGTVTNDGVLPFSIIQAFDGNFYGAAESGGANSAGTIFKMTPQGVVSNFYSFNGNLGIAGPRSLIQAANGDFIGTSGNQIFRLTQTGTLTLLHIFPGINQIQPLVQGFDGDFYSVVAQGGTALYGFAYKITPQGDVTILHNFRDGSVANDGITPQAALIQASDGNFYGTTTNGGTAGSGAIFKMTPTGTVTILHNFGDHTVTNDGNYPQSSLVEGTDGNFYGTTGFSSASSGTVFKMTPQGTVTILHVFGSTNDGSQPLAGLIQGYDGNFYGTTVGGGTFAEGTAFQITPQGVLTIIHNFGDTSFAIDGTAPRTPLIQSPAGNFYGVTSQGGTSGTGSGAIFSFNAMQAPTNVPIFIGSAYQLSAIYSPFSFTPKALFGVSGAGEVNQGQSVQPSGSILSSLVQSFFPQTVHPFFSTTNWTLTGTLPNYLTYDTSSGTISGTPVQAGTFTVTLTPHNAVGSGLPMTVTFFIDVPPGISSPVSISTAINTPFNYQIASTPPASDYGASNLPGWLSVDSVSGIISGTPPAAGAYVFDAVASNVSGQTSQVVALTVTGGSSSVPTITSATTASISIASPFDYQITASPAATGFTAFSLPAGLVFDASSGDIFGTPTAAGTYEIPLAAVNSNGTYASVLTLTVTQPMPPGIAPTLSATAGLNVPFSYQIPTTGTVTGYAATGTLPNGITFDSTLGIFSGTPTGTGSFPINLTVTNAQGSSTSTLTITVVAPQSFSDWQNAFNTTGDPGDTPFHDGIPNLLKYLYHIDPTHAIAPADRPALPVKGVVTVNGTQYLTLTYRQYLRQTGLNIAVQSSPDLVTWTTDSTTADQPQPTGVSDPVTGDPYVQVKVPVTTAGQFIRFNVIAP